MTDVRRRYAVAAETITELGPELYRVRCLLGMTQARVAAEIGLSSAMISYVERDRVSPTVRVAVLILNWLDARCVDDRDRDSPLLRSSRPSSQTLS